MELLRGGKFWNRSYDERPAFGSWCYQSAIYNQVRWLLSRSCGQLFGKGWKWSSDLGIPGSPGVPEAISNLTITAEFNSQASVEQALGKVGADQIAAIIVEPIPGNMGLVMPDLNFLKFLREVCDQHGIVLVFDEVMSGFRVHPQGAQGLFGIVPDLTTLGKVIGGGMPVAVFGGKRELMEQLAPSGPVYQAGTLSGNPIAMAAGIAVLRELQRPGVWESLGKLTAHLSDGLISLAKSHSIPLTAKACGECSGFSFARRKLKVLRKRRMPIHKCSVIFSAVC